MRAGGVGQERGVVDAGRDAALGDRLERVGVVVPRAGPGLGHRGGAVAEPRAVAAARGAGAVEDELLEVRVRRRAVEHRRLLRGGDAGERAGEEQAQLRVGDRLDGGVVERGERERVEEVELALEVERGGLPARGGERGGVARVLRLVLGEHRVVDVREPQRRDEQRDRREQHEQDHLPAPPVAARLSSCV